MTTTFEWSQEWSSYTGLTVYKEAHVFFYKQSVYKQLALGWQIAKQLSEITPFSLSNSKNYRLTKSGVFPL